MSMVGRSAEEDKIYKITLQNPKPSDFAALKNFSVDWESRVHIFQCRYPLKSWAITINLPRRTPSTFHAHLALYQLLLDCSPSTPKSYQWLSTDPENKFDTPATLTLLQNRNSSFKSLYDIAREVAVILAYKRKRRLSDVTVTERASTDHALLRWLLYNNVCFPRCSLLFSKPGTL